jgi:hypothetical protein
MDEIGLCLTESGQMMWHYGEGLEADFSIEVYVILLSLKQVCRSSFRVQNIRNLDFLVGFDFLPRLYSHC